MSSIIGPKELILFQVGILVLGTLLALILTPICRRMAFRFGVLDNPGTRKVHKEPKPLLGGLAIFLSFDIVLFVLWRLGYIGPAHSLQVLSIAAGGLVIMIVGLIDDIRPMKARVKLLMQVVISVVAALIIIWGDVRLSVYVLDANDVLAFVVTVIWVVGITNSFNLLDNMDGLSAGVSVIASISFAVIGVMQCEPVVSMLSLAIAGSCLGFLRYNLHPSRIFMGDAGSMFVGFTLASVAVLGVYTRITDVPKLAVMTPLLVLAVPIFDTASVIWIRWRGHQPIFVGDKNHLSHRLVSFGMSQSKAVLFIYLVAGLMGLMGILVSTLKIEQAVFLFLYAAATFVIIGILLSVRRSGAGRDHRRD
ncbi:MAG: undecaprenyl/decaprenyl-phosphate alpha-N-acetylglucosaminyl 1-phosphate transferase [Candidatus Coatesbacteria bacterium]|nr:MAG: undecaprenyl/decaprenyl-phosphate alpha-N-acetylglucosaminyl 1-phosphate transferase [Candidatus Coatesbacteria bacterium]